MSELSTYFIEKAKSELNENETRKNESIILFKEWLKNHPFIKYQNPDLVHLLMFLRSKKYKMNKVFESFESSFLYLKSISNFDQSDAKLENLLANCNKIFSVIKERKKSGEKILIIKMKEIEELDISVVQLVRLIYNMITTLLCEEETQISGIVLAYDFQKSSQNLFKNFNLADFSQYLINVNFFAVRIKQIIFIDLPTFAVQILELVRRVLSEKLKQRIIAIKDLIELEKVLNIQNLFIENEYNEKNFTNFDENVAQAYHMFTKIEVNFNKVRKFENLGSFRKLDID